MSGRHRNAAAATGPAVASSVARDSAQSARPDPDLLPIGRVDLFWLPLGAGGRSETEQGHARPRQRELALT